MIRNGATQIMGRLVRRRLPTSSSTMPSSMSSSMSSITTTISSSSVSGVSSVSGLRWKSSNLHKRAVTALNKNAKVMTLKNNNKPTKKEEQQQQQQQQQHQPAATATKPKEASTSPTTLPSSSSTPSVNDKTPQINGAAAAPAPPPLSSSAALPPLPFHQGHLMEFAPRIVVVGVGGGGGNAVNNMIANDLQGVDFLALNTDAQHLSTTLTDNRIQIGTALTSGLGCGANPDAGRLAAEESKSYIEEAISDAHMVFITAGMGGGTGTGAAPVVAELCYNMGILTVGVVTKPFRFEGTHRMRLANEGVDRLSSVVDTLIVIPNQNLFALANDSTSFMDSFQMADNVLLAGVKSITDLMTAPGLINLDFADVQSVMHGMGNAMLGTGLASHEDANGGTGTGTGTNSKGNGTGTVERAVMAAEMALSNPLVGENMDVATAKGMLVNITGGKDMTLFEVDRAAQCITERIIDENANIIFGSAYDESLDGSIRVSVVATGIEEVKGIPITSTIIQ